ncbi:hypothetical protein GPJ56_007430 [Histomonas meleagridis]|uniref:uncharacterized protein n=1 Tax=Histomonas meleagridis TaxID=135588 RepID=UPI00355AA4A1|nr:hypothetical protein GPJ56_007430 [Histomonas meleagridis]KAH0804276.1 hypothetical protein GO595_003106 [Histomonas meleagridis]
MFRNLLEKASNAVNYVISSDKITDPEYDAAEQELKKLSLETDKIIGYLIKLQTHLEKLSRTSANLGEDVDKWFIDAPQESKLKAKTFLSVGKHFDALTVNFLHPRLEPHVISILSNYQAEVLNMEKVKKDRKKALDKYQKTLSAKDATEDQKAKDREEYEKLNQEFITNVKSLSERRAKELEIPFRNFTCIMSQYLMQVFTEIQKFRTTFPPELFQKDEPKNAAE